MKYEIKIDKYYLLIILAGSLFGFVLTLFNCPITRNNILNYI